MNSTDVGQLEALLSAALQNVVFRRGSAEQLSRDQFRQVLEQGRRAFALGTRLLILTFTPTISDPNLNEELLSFVGAKLSEYSRNGQIQSATFAFAGGMVGGSSVGRIVENLLRRVVLDGPRVTAQAFAECAANVSCSHYKYLLLPDISVEAPVELLPGVSVLPLPKTVADLPPHLPTLDSNGTTPNHPTRADLLGRSLLRLKFDVSPVFHKPEESYTLESGPEEHFTVKHSDGVEIDSDTLWQALSVACRRNVRSVMTWHSLADYEIYDLGSYPGVGASGWSLTGGALPFEDPTPVRGSQLENVETIYKAIQELPNETWAKLRIPVDRWMKSMEQDNPIDQLIDLGIALESLYVPEAQSEITFRFALHAAWHLGESASERMKLREEFQEIYRARSDAVHAGQLRGRRGKPSFDVEGFVARAQDLCWQGISDVIEAGEIPDWDILIVGKDGE